MKTLDVQISRQVIDAAIAYIAFEMKKAIKQAVENMTPELIRGMDMHRDMEMQTRALISISQKMEKLEGSGNTKELSELLSAVQKLKMPDLKGIELSMKAMTTKESGIPSAKEILDEMRLTLQQIKFPDTVKLDAMQVRALTPRMPMNGGVKSATRVTQNNTSLTANTEGNYTFPSNTVNFIIKLRDPSAKLFYAWTTGTLPTSGTGALYFTSPQGFIRGQENIEFSGRVIYIQSDKTTTAEIEVFRL